MLGGALWSDAPAYILKIIMKCKEIKVEYAWNVVIGGGAPPSIIMTCIALKLFEIAS